MMTGELHLLTVIQLAPFITAQPAWDVSWSVATALTTHTPQGPPRAPARVPHQEAVVEESSSSPTLIGLLAERMSPKEPRHKASLRHVSLSRKVILNSAVVTRLK